MTVVQAINDFINKVPDVVNSDSDIFNHCVSQIQNALGQHGGGPAAQFFEDDWFTAWSEAVDRENKYELLKGYIKVEVEHLPVETD